MRKQMEMALIIYGPPDLKSAFALQLNILSHPLIP